LSLEVGDGAITSWIQYPNHFKFFSANIQLSQDINYVERSTYDLLDMAGDIGGVLEVLMLIASVIVHPFSKMRLQSIITNRFFILSQSMLEILMSDNRKNMEDLFLERRARDKEVIVNVPKNLVMEKILSVLCMFCLQDDRFERYAYVVQKGQE